MNTERIKQGAVMASGVVTDLKSYCEHTAREARAASYALAQATTQQKNAWLKRSAMLLRENAASILAANELDVAAAPRYGLNEAQIDRLRLSPSRVEAIAVGLEEVAELPDPIGEIIEASVRPNGLKISKVRVPLGVVFFVYESRPNVTADAAAICIKSGNAAILRGGKEAAHSSRAIVDVLRDTLSEFDLPTSALHLVEVPDRDAVSHFLALDEYIDVAIPRGGESLIRRVSAEAKMPVMKHFHGNCHVYVDRDADLSMALEIVVNAKCQRMGVCNACESLLVHGDVASEFLPTVAKALANYEVEIRGDQRVCEILPQASNATESDYATEYLAPIISACVVDSLDEAIEHINRYGSKHTDAIVTSDEVAAEAFLARVDSAAVLVNASTRFNDGYELGLGAEIGISTDKFHARGPCGLKELTTYKWIVRGSGQIRK